MLWREPTEVPASQDQRVRRWPSTETYIQRLDADRDVLGASTRFRMQQSGIIRSVTDETRVPLEESLGQLLTC